MVFHERNTSGVNEKGFVFLGPGCVSVYARACDRAGLRCACLRCVHVCACVRVRVCMKSCVRARVHLAGHKSRYPTHICMYVMLVACKCV